MKCIVTKKCWPNADTVWLKGQIVDASPVQYALLGEYLKKVPKPKPVEKVVEDGAEK